MILKQFIDSPCCHLGLHISVKAKNVAGLVFANLTKLWCEKTALIIITLCPFYKHLINVVPCACPLRSAPYVYSTYTVYCSKINIFLTQFTGFND